MLATKTEYTSTAPLSTAIADRSARPGSIERQMYDVQNSNYLRGVRQELPSEQWEVYACNVALIAWDLQCCIIHAANEYCDSVDKCNCTNCQRQRHSGVC